MSSEVSSKVAVVMGSVSDEDVMKRCIEYLKYFSIPYEVHVMSAHREPDRVDEFAEKAEERGICVVIAGAGMAAALPGVIASKTTIPVIGVPLDASPLNGMDAVYSILQMPPGIPVGTVAIGSAGAKNAAVLAAEIIALQDPDLRKRLREFRRRGSKI